MAEDLGFSYQARKDGTVRITHNGRRAATLRALDAAEFLAELEDLSPADAQQLMARVTGQYKHGNERVAKSHPRNRH